MEKSGEAREAPVTFHGAAYACLSSLRLPRRSHAAPIPNRRGTRASVRMITPAPKGVRAIASAPWRPLLPYNLVNGSPRACCGAGTLRWQNALRHRSALW